jgi:hypothetical protein
MYDILLEQRLVTTALVFTVFLLLGLIIIILAYGHEQYSQSNGATTDATDHSEGLS